MREQNIENLNVYVKRKKEVDKRFKTEKEDLQNDIDILEEKLSKDLEFEEHKEYKEKLEYSKDKLQKFLKKERENPEEIINGIDESFVLISQGIKKEYEEKSKVVYENFKNSLKEIIEVLDQRNNQVSELNNKILGEKGINGRELKEEFLKEFESGNISIISDSNKNITIKQRYGNYASDVKEVHIK